MCGIAGIVLGETGELPGRFSEGIRHRGPDERGWLIADDRVLVGRGLPPTCEAGRLLLVHHRLSILDLSETGRQPMASPDGRYHLIFNGEIYNYVELRDRLEEDGVRFRGSSDTEVLLALLGREGPAALERLEGMFAFALYDHVEGSVLLARDFFGIKPLYFHAGSPGGIGPRFAFASEIGPLLELDGVSRRPNRQAIFDYLRYGLTDHTEATCLSGVRQLPPGCYLRIDLARPTRAVPERYWTLRRRTDLADITFPEAVSETRRLFLSSVSHHLRSDVPVGSALSGGIDSSSIVMAVRKVAPDAEIRTFSFVASRDDLSEERWARMVGEAASAKMFFTKPTESDLLDDLGSLVRVQGEPFGTTSIFAQYRVFALARHHGIKVMLDGQGADEALGGYDYFAGARLAAMLSRGRWWRAARFANVVRHQPGRSRLALEAGPFLFPRPVAETLRPLVGRESVPAWLDAAWFREADVHMTAPLRPTGREAFRDELMSSLVLGLPKLLRYEDRNSMAHSVESRVPFLVPGLVEFLISLPEHFLLSEDGRSKHVFREAMSGILPEPVRNRTDKVGFVTPEFDWLAGVDGWLQEQLSRPGPFISRVLLDQWDQAKATGTHDARFWRCLNLVLWSEAFQVEWG